MTRALHALGSFGLTLAIGFSVAAPAQATGQHRVIVVKDSIQAAIDAAQPGDTIVVPPGTYSECPIVATDGLTIRGSKAAVLDASSCSAGLTVGTGRITTDPETGATSCPPIQIEGFTLDGLTIQNASFTGIFLIGVSDFRVTGGRYVANGEYGIFPRCSHDGLVAANVVDGAQVARDAGIYVGVDERVKVEKNVASGGPIGIEVENSLDTQITGNIATGNTVGLVTVILPGLPTAATDGVRIEGNLIARNNFPNPFAPTDDDDIALIPTGTGILNVGADAVLIRRNLILNNDSVGVAIVADPFAALDPRIDPTPDDGVVRNNVIVGNGKNPDPARPMTPAGDIAYDGSSATTCFADNLFGTDVPAGVTAAFPCQ